MISGKERTTESDAGEQTVLISFYVDREETVVCWLDDSSPETQVDRVSLGRNEIATAAEMLQDFFSPGRIHYRRPEYSTDMMWLEPLGNKLLQPLKDRLRTCRALVVSPHAELHLLPLHLLAPRDGLPLGITHSITYIANLSLYALLLDRAVADPEDLPLSSLCLSTAAAEDRDLVHESFAKTPRVFAQKMGGVFLQGNNATWQAFRHYAESARCLNLSCHGCFDEDKPLESFLLLSDGHSLPSRENSKNSPLHRLSVRDILDMRVRSFLVILDACMSGNQHFSPGDEPMGFPTAFLLSGAGAVIASNWVVEHNCGRDFLASLVDHWSSGSLSLGQAMLEAYSATRAKYPHPFHWAAFSLFGNDRMLFH